MVSGKGAPDLKLTENEVLEIVAGGIPVDLFKNKRVLVLTPDTTRTCPLPLMVRTLGNVIGKRAAQLDFMVALGTHTPMLQADIRALFGLTGNTQDALPLDSQLFNHRWDLPETLQPIGELTQDEIKDISGGLLRERVAVAVNRKIYDYDHIIIVGPVFPHEVVGFSGGAKYIFPGISGGDFLHFFHWLGAVITCAKTIGIKHTPVRRAIDRAMEMIQMPVHCLAMVASPDNSLCGLYTGDVQAAWSQAADLSAQIHIKTKDEPFQIVLGRAPEMYDEIWTAGKVMYKLEQVVADGGRLIIYGPHISEVSRTWGRDLDSIGYHIRDYFLANMHRFRNVPRGVLAHSTHVRGTGTYVNGEEKPRIEVVLATGISKKRCDRLNLGYLDPATIQIADYKGREDHGILFVDHAGEMLYRLASTNVK